jgi:hypothetical protein
MRRSYRPSAGAQPERVAPAGAQALAVESSSIIRPSGSSALSMRGALLGCELDADVSVVRPDPAQVVTQHEPQ